MELRAYIIHFYRAGVAYEILFLRVNCHFLVFIQVYDFLNTNKVLEYSQNWIVPFY